MARRLNGWQQSVKKMREGFTRESQGPAAFEALVAEKGLTEEEAADNPGVQAWIQQHYTRHFVPEAILTYMVLTVTDSQLGFVDFSYRRKSGHQNRKISGGIQHDSV